MTITSPSGFFKISFRKSVIGATILAESLIYSLISVANPKKCSVLSFSSCHLTTTSIFLESFKRPSSDYTIPRYPIQLYKNLTFDFLAYNLQLLKTINTSSRCPYVLPHFWKTLVYHPSKLESTLPYKLSEYSFYKVINVASALKIHYIQSSNQFLNTSQPHSTNLPVHQIQEMDICS